MLQVRWRKVVILAVIGVAAVWATAVALLYACGPRPRERMQRSLQETAESGSLGKTRILLALGVDPNRGSGVGWTALHWAAYRGDEDIARLLLDHGAQVNARTEVLYGAPDCPSLQATQSPLKTPLFAAVTRGNVKMARLLLDRGADLKARGNWDETALHWAAREGETAVAELLLSRGADVNTRDRNGETPLHRAIIGQGWPHWSLLFVVWDEARRKQIVDTTEARQLLIDHGADPNVADENGWTPLHWATVRHNKTAVLQLVEKGADVNARVKKKAYLRPVSRVSGTAGGPGQGALHLAAAVGDLDLMKLLIAHGGEVSARDDSGRTPLDEAHRNSQEEAAKLLLIHNAESRYGGRRKAGSRGMYSR